MISMRKLSCSVNIFWPRPTSACHFMLRLRDQGYLTYRSQLSCYGPVVCAVIFTPRLSAVMLLCAVSLHKCLVSSDVVPTALGPSPHVPVVGT